MKFRVSVQVLPRRGILDPQGKAVSDALHSLGFGQISDVHIGRHLVIETTADSAEAAGASVRAMCQKLLANPVTEDFSIASVVAE
jgi:phosphoribosylformylglycinamidine synthase